MNGPVHSANKISYYLAIQNTAGKGNSIFLHLDLALQCLLIWGSLAFLDFSAVIFFCVYSTLFILENVFPEIDMDVF